MEHNVKAGSRSEREHYTPRRIQFLLGHLRELVGEILVRPAIPADLIISRFFASRRYLGSHDRGFISDAAYAILRGILRYHALLGDMMGSDADRAAAIAVAAYVVESAQVMDAVAVEGTLGLRAGDLARVAGTLAAGRDTAARLAPPERTAVAVGMPVWFVRSVMEELGEEEGRSLLEALDRQAPITLRANTLLTDRDRLIAALSARDIPALPGAYAPEAVILERRMNAHSIPEFRSGWFELQDEGSQLLGRLLDPRPNWRVFDACAGAGGKTLHLAALMRGRGELVAHDVNSRRLSEIRPRLKRSGVQNVRVMEHDLYRERRERLMGTFHALLIDAPCSGTGVLRRNPGARLTLEPGLVERIALEQEAILEEYAPLVRPGGVMLYATCSVLRRENEEQVLGFLKKHEEWRLESPQVPEGMRTGEGMFRCAPHLHGTDGFFGALLRRVG